VQLPTESTMNTHDVVQSSKPLGKCRQSVAVLDA